MRVILHVRDYEIQLGPISLEPLSTRDVFERPLELISNGAWRTYPSHVGVLPHAVLSPSQIYLAPEKVKWQVNQAEQNQSQDSLPAIVKQGDKYVIADGHHRIAADSVRGLKESRVRIYG